MTTTKKIKTELTGYSNGVAYSLLDCAENYGLVELPEWIFPVWCRFDYINKSINKNRFISR